METKMETKKYLYLDDIICPYCCPKCTIENPYLTFKVRRRCNYQFYSKASITSECYHCSEIFNQQVSPIIQFIFELDYAFSEGIIPFKPGQLNLYTHLFGQDIDVGRDVFNILCRWESILYNIFLLDPGKNDLELVALLEVILVKHKSHRIPSLAEIIKYFEEFLET